MIKILLGGSPCTYWSIAQKNNRETEPSGIGWELFENYLIAKEKFKPDFFLYENNKSAAQAIKDEIKKRLNAWDGTLFMQDSGARYIEINSALVSAQNRQRFYVHNCGEVGQPQDRGILLKDILESGQGWTDKSYAITASYDGAVAWNTLERHQRTMVAEPVIFQLPHGYNNGGCKYDKSPTLTANAAWQENNKVVEPVRVGDLPNASGEISGSQATRIYSIDGKSVNLVANGGGLGEKTGLYACPFEVEELAEDYYHGDKNTNLFGKIISKNTSNNNGQPAQCVRVYNTANKSICLDGDGRKYIIDSCPNNVEKVKGINNKIVPVCEVHNGQITIKGKQYPIKLADGFYIIRKLTVTECCRLQTMPEIEHYLYINFNIGEIWSDLQKINAQYAAEKCHKLQKFAKDVQKIDLLEFAQFVENNTNIKLQQISEPVLLSVHTNLEGLSNQKDYSRELLKNANIVGKNLRCLNQGQTEIFAQAVVGITTMLRKITQIGMVELHLKDKIFAVVKNGKMQFTLCGTEIMRLVKDADINMNKVKKAITSTILEVLPSLEICEQILTTLFCYVLNAIGGYILQKTNGEILLKIKTPYTYAVSATQGYRGLGNGWTAEVIIHILSNALKDIPKDEKIVVLSMYDGIGTGRYVLDKMGFTNVEYHAYEIDKYAMQIAMSNYPDIIQHGDAYQVREEDWKI